MNVFETQINNALDGLPSMGEDSLSRPSTPNDSILGSPRFEHSSNLRPVTRKSERSELS